MPVDFQAAHRLLQEFDFHTLFIEEFGWQQPESNRIEPFEVEETHFERQRIAQMSEVPVFEIVAEDGDIPRADLRSAVYKEISESFAENLLIFINGDRTRSLWFWAKREGAKFYPRTDSYIKRQPVDLLLSKIGGLNIEPEELDEEGKLPTFEVADRLQKSLDVEKVTKKFYQAFQLKHQEFLDYIQGIDNEGDRRWYTSVILNRLMFVYFLQKKGFINRGNVKYLRKKLTESQERGTDRFYNEFLETLFFEGLAKPERDRSSEAQKMLGKVCYLNGGLFLKHSIELNERYSIRIPDEAFEKVFDLFDSYSWHLDDRPGGKPNEINPDVLGYIFEKYINQKAFGAYYTRPEITEYLCDRTINKLILDRVNAAVAEQNRPSHEIQSFDSIDDMVMHMDIEVCRHLIMGEDAILRNLSLLDPACGSGAFLIAAMKTLIRVYERVIGVVQLSTDHQLRGWLDEVMRDHPSLSYFIKKRIITDNLYGVDIMEEAVEIAKLRLFLALVSSAMKVNELEPLPNIDFNIMAGNSLIGLIRVNDDAFNKLVPSKGVPTDPTQTNLLEETVVQGSLLGLEAANRYQEILEEKNRSIELYKKHAFQREDPGGTEQDIRLLNLRSHIDQVNWESEIKLNQILLSEFSSKLGIKFEQAQLSGRPIKRLLTTADIEALKPFHWGYHFDKVIEKHGGFDAIITNPPWETFQPDAKEFFSFFSDEVSKKKMSLKAFKAEMRKLLKSPEVARKWLNYQSQFIHLRNYFRIADQYRNQVPIINGKRHGKDVNLYKLFLEQCLNLLKPLGECGIVIPSGIYTDLGAKKLREMLFTKTCITGLFCFENRKEIFDNVHRSFKFVVLTFEKGKETVDFPAKFMRHEVKEISNFPDNESLFISVELIRKLSPESLSVMEMKSHFDLSLNQKLARFPLLCEDLDGKWNIKLHREFNMTDDAYLFEEVPTEQDLPVYEGKIIHQFEHRFSTVRHYINEQRGRTALLKRNQIDTGQVFDYQHYRLCFRDVASSTNERTLIASVIPPNVFTVNTLVMAKPYLNNSETLYIAAIFNSFVCDFLTKQKVTSHCNMFYIYQLPIPRLVEGDPYFPDIVERAAKLICTTPEFDDLATEVGLGSHANGVTDEAERAQLRAELDGMITHLYGLTEAEFTHILSTFPVVPEETKQAALEEYRKFAPLAGDQEIIDLINQGESAKLEFKSTARWDLRENKKNKVIEEIILKTVAAFLNTDGGTLLIGVADDGSIVGLQPDMQTLRKKDRDGYELWLLGDLLLATFGNAMAPFFEVSFGLVDAKDVCRVNVKPGPEPVYITTKALNPGGQPQECFFIRTGNSTNKLDKPSDIVKYSSKWASPKA